MFPHEQAEFRHGKGTVDQVALMTNDIEHSFDEKKKVGAVFVDLSSSHDIVGHCGFTFKLLKKKPNKNIFKIIAEIISQRLFLLHLGNKNQENDA